MNNMPSCPYHGDTHGLIQSHLLSLQFSLLGFKWYHQTRIVLRIMGIIKMMKMWISWYLYMDQENNCIECSSVQFSHSVMSNSLWPHGQQYSRLPYPSPAPGVYSNSCHWVGDGIQLSHSLSSLSPPAFNLSQCQGLLKWVSSLHQVAKVLEFQLQHQSFQWIFRTDFI